MAPVGKRQRRRAGGVGVGLTTAPAVERTWEKGRPGPPPPADTLTMQRNRRRRNDPTSWPERTHLVKTPLLHEVATALSGLALAERVLRDRVRDARRAGATWAEVGDALGVTRQAAQHRFGG